MGGLWEAVKPWLPWTVPAMTGALILVFACLMIWPDRTARAFGIFAIVWDSFGKRIRRSRGRAEPAPDRSRRQSSEPMPPTITGFAVPPTERPKPETD